MAQFCLHCRVAADDYKRFCGSCGQPLVPGVEAEAQLRTELQDAPGDPHILEQLVHLLQVGGSRESELAELRLRWCESLLVLHPQGEQLDDIRRAFTSIPKELLSSAAIGRAVNCLDSLYVEAGDSERLAEEAAQFSRVTRGKLLDAARDAWVQACLRWGDADLERRPHRAHVFYNYAAETDPGSSGIAERLERLRAIERRSRVRILVAVALVILLSTISLLVIRHFTDPYRKGGAEIVLNVRTLGMGATVRDQALRSSIEVLRASLKDVRGSKVVLTTPERILVRAPLDIRDIESILKPPRIEFKVMGTHEQVLSGNGLVAGAKALVGLDHAHPDAWGVGITLTPRGRADFARITGNNVGSQLAIVVDNVVTSSSIIRERIPNGEVSITGDFDVTSARRLALGLRSGALPVQFEIAEEHSIPPR